MALQTIDYLLLAGFRWQSLTSFLACAFRYSTRRFIEFPRECQYPVHQYGPSWMSLEKLLISVAVAQRTLGVDSDKSSKSQQPSAGPQQQVSHRRW